MRIITANLNGIRSATDKGFFDWFGKQRADVLCLQETKAQREQLTGMACFPRGWHAYFNDARTKKGYSGVAVYAKREPDTVIDKLGWGPFDNEGRYLELRFGKLSVVSLYLPSGSSGEERQAFKFQVMDWITPMLKAWAKSDRQYVLCGDWNIAHKNVDLKNWRSNQKNSGFLPEERAWLDRVFGELAWVDAYRALKPEAVEYTWWSNRGQAWANNVGWRIDYHVVTPNLRAALKRTSIYREQRFSDHAPMIVDYDL
jgi:exodeoxyribonuclease-3